MYVLLALALSVISFNSNAQARLANSEKALFTENEKNTIKVFQEGVNSVVFVSNMRSARSLWSYGEVEVPAGAGSGYVWDTNGHIVTNYHVVEGGDSFLISFHKDTKQYKAKLIGAEPRQDIAVLQLEERPTHLIPIKVGSSKELVVGQKAMAIGNPFGLDHTVTEGIVSALDRKIDGIGGVKIHGMIQTDASINPGNSGGPLINSSGEMIGMNTVIYSNSGSSAGVGFAVPVDSVKRIVPELIQFGKVVRPGLGIGLANDNIRYHFGIDSGVVIAQIDPKGPAAIAGLKGMSQDSYGRYYIGDVIVEIDGKKVNSYDDLFHVFDQYKVGENVEVTYLRKNKSQKVKIKLGKI
jgi:S1-C subfamily serine protease